MKKPLLVSFTSPFALASSKKTWVVDFWELLEQRGYLKPTFQEILVFCRTFVVGLPCKFVNG